MSPLIKSFFTGRRPGLSVPGVLGEFHRRRESGRPADRPRRNEFDHHGTRARAADRDVRVWSDNGATIQREFLAFDPAFIGGVFVG